MGGTGLTPPPPPRLGAPPDRPATRDRASVQGGIGGGGVRVIGGGCLAGQDRCRFFKSCGERQSTPLSVRVISLGRNELRPIMTAYAGAATRGRPGRTRLLGTGPVMAVDGMSRRFVSLLTLRRIPRRCEMPQRSAECRPDRN